MILMCGPKTREVLRSILAHRKRQVWRRLFILLLQQPPCLHAGMERPA
jgi:hypothetical protein